MPNDRCVAESHLPSGSGYVRFVVKADQGQSSFHLPGEI